MTAKPKPTDSAVVESDLVFAPPSRLRRIGLAIIALLLLTIAADYAGAFGYRGNDWNKFEGQPVHVVRVIDGESIVVRHAGANAETVVRLLGVATPGLPATTQANASEILQSRLLERDVVLTLPPTITRDAEQRLLVYAYLGTECINLALIDAGVAYADRREKHPFHGAFEQAENEARLKKWGMWATLTFNDQPAWRQSWLKSLSKPATRPVR